jgi:hypothetical protein
MRRATAVFGNRSLNRNTNEEAAAWRPLRHLRRVPALLMTFLEIYE